MIAWRLRWNSSRRPTRRRKTRTLAARLTAAADKLAFNWKVREAFYRHISSQSGNGVPLEIALASFRDRLKRRRRVSSDKIVAHVARTMRNGSSFASALAQWVPQDEIAIINSGELAGSLSRSLDLVIDAKKRVGRVVTAVKASVISPAVYAVAVYAMLWAIGMFVTPTLTQTLPREKTTGIVFGLYMTSDLANSLWAIFPPMIALSLVFLVMWSLPRWTGKSRLIAEGYFPYNFYRDIHGYTWLMSFSAQLRAGMADVEILRRQMAQASPWLKERLHALWWRMENGASLSAALLPGDRRQMTYGFPNPDIVDDITSLHGFRDFPEKIAVLARDWAEQLEATTLARARAFGFWMELAMYAVMGLLMVAINSMSTQMGSVTGLH